MAEVGNKDEGRIRPPGPDQQLKVKHRLQYGTVRILDCLAQILPWAWLKHVGHLIGVLFYRTDKHHRQIALLNVDQAFGSTKTEKEKQKLVKSCFSHFGRAIIETFKFRTLPKEQFLSRYIELDNIDEFQRGLELGKGVILCSAHYGNWEVMNLALGYLNLPLSVMARPVDNPLVHCFLEKIRTCSGNRVIYKHKSVRKLLANLKENRVIGIVNDQDIHDRNRIFTTFFGRAASTTPVPAALSIKTGAPIIMGFATPRKRRQYHLAFSPMIKPNPAAEKEDDILRITEEMNRYLEQQIQEAPPYWLWMHKRYKTSVDGVGDFYQRKRKP